MIYATIIAASLAMQDTRDAGQELSRFPSEAQCHAAALMSDAYACGLEAQRLRCLSIREYHETFAVEHELRVRARTWRALTRAWERHREGNDASALDWLRDVERFVGEADYGLGVMPWPTP